MAKQRAYDPTVDKGDAPSTVTIRGDDPKLGEKIARTKQAWGREEGAEKARQAEVLHRREKGGAPDDDYYMKKVGEEGRARQQRDIGQEGTDRTKGKMEEDAEKGYAASRAKRQAKTSSKYK